MNFNLKRPCAHCPFRNDRPGFLSKGRARSIKDSIVDRQETFPCHKTTVLIEEDDGESDMVVTAKSEHCAGATILLEKIGRPNQLMRIAGRMGIYDPEKLDMESPVFDTFSDWIKAQPR